MMIRQSLYGLIPKQGHPLIVVLLLGMIGSVDEYATILGKTTKQLAQEVFQPPEVSESEVREAASLRSRLIF